MMNADPAVAARADVRLGRAESVGGVSAAPFLSSAVDRDEVAEGVAVGPGVVAHPVRGFRRPVGHGTQCGSGKASAVPGAADAVVVEVRRVIAFRARTAGAAEVADVR